MRLLVNDKEIPPPVDSSIRLYLLCAAFDFKHLPIPGGLYDQHPQFLDRFMYIRQELNKAEEKKQAAERRKNKPPTPHNAGQRPF